MKDNNTRAAEQIFPSGHQPPSDYQRPAEHAHIVCDKDIAVAMRDGVKVVVDPLSLPLIDGTLVDFVKQGLNEAFKFQNPKAKGECGCGESFNV